MTSIAFLYVTAPDAGTAERIAQALVEARAAACVNILPGMRSLYRWKGALEAADEVVMIVKTTLDAAPRARDLVLKLHPYETPCVAVLPTTAAGSNAAHFDWIRNEVSSSSSAKD